MKVELLVGSREFWDRLKTDLEEAEESAYVQTLSFEGDRVGSALGRALERSPAADRRLLIDDYSRVVHNDRWVFGPAWLERAYRREVMSTFRWVDRLRSRGTAVRFANPLGTLLYNFPMRNHKKLALLDRRVAYLGGINFSEHNFEWHDMMFRIEDPSLGEVLGEDFEASWVGQPRAGVHDVGALRLISTRGRGSAHHWDPVIDLIRGARNRIDVANAYLSHPFTALLGEAKRRGVRVRVLTPEVNNKPHLALHVAQEALRHGFELLRYPGVMSHMKAMLVDDETLVAGSGNFDPVSYYLMDEYIFITRHSDFVDAFRTRAWEPAAASAEPFEPRATVATRTADAMVRLGAALFATLAPADRRP